MPIYHTTRSICIAIPGGVLAARHTFWGYHISGGSGYSFLKCPPGYCCDSRETMCESYDSCAVNREGFLCGRCKQGKGDVFGKTFYLKHNLV